MSALRAETSLLDTREMIVVHSLFRRELRLAGGLVRRVPPADRARATVVAAHLDLVERVLSSHHTSEDALLWPLLRQRVGTELAPVVELMASQHEQVDGLLRQIAADRSAWARDPGAARGEELGARYDELYAGLAEHLDAEEARVLPLVARCISAAEWAALGEAGRSGIPRNEMALVFGMLMHEGDPEVVTAMLAPAPLPVRLLVPRLGRRAFRRHALRVHGTPTP
jgi:hypothetical protein